MLIKSPPQKLDSIAIITARFSRGTEEKHLGESVRQNQKSPIAGLRNRVSSFSDVYNFKYNDPEKFLYFWKLG